MSWRGRIALFCAAAALLAAGAALLALGGDRRGEERRAKGAGAEGAGGPKASAPAPAQALEELRRVEDERGERGRPPRAIQKLERVEEHEAPSELEWLHDERRTAEPIARRFFAAFSLYELGRHPAGVELELRATATRGFARELIAMPPRVPARGRAPARARLRELELVPGRYAPSGELLELELLATVSREGRRSPLAIEMRREPGGWRVSGLGR